MGCSAGPKWRGRASNKGVGLCPGDRTLWGPCGVLIERRPGTLGGFLSAGEQVEGVCRGSSGAVGSQALVGGTMGSTPNPLPSTRHHGPGAMQGEVQERSSARLHSSASATRCRLSSSRSAATSRCPLGRGRGWGQTGSGRMSLHHRNCCENQSGTPTLPHPRTGDCWDRPYVHGLSCPPCAFLFAAREVGCINTEA